MVLYDEINEIEEELNVDEFDFNSINNVVPKLEEFGEPGRRNAHLWDPNMFKRDKQPIFPRG